LGSWSSLCPPSTLLLYLVFKHCKAHTIIHPFWTLLTLRLFSNYLLQDDGAFDHRASFLCLFFLHDFFCFNIGGNSPAHLNHSLRFVTKKWLTEWVSIHSYIAKAIKIIPQKLCLLLSYIKQVSQLWYQTSQPTLAAWLYLQQITGETYVRRCIMNQQCHQEFHWTTVK